MNENDPEKLWRLVKELNQEFERREKQMRKPEGSITEGQPE
jgi:hypothetical protein